ncbi:MAG: geranylgeranyl reductase family protein [Candidatus Helarchaeota archaeon]
MASTYDLVVVGAGPAGSMAARAAAYYGLSVLVIEQKQIVGFPSHCAGGILTSILNKIGIFPIVKKAICSKISKMRFISPMGTIVHHNFSRNIGYIVDRPKFDQLLIKDAQKRGAEIRTSTRAIGLKKENNQFTQIIIKSHGTIQTIHSKIIIGADGIASNIAKWAGLIIPRNYIGIGFGYNAENIKGISSDTVEIYFLSAVPGGYCWIFPRGINSANIGVGGYNTGSYMKKVFNWFRNKHPFASPKLKNCKLTNYTGGIVPGSKIPAKTTFNYGMIVGDACNHVDPLTGEGIRLALICGDLAGKIAAYAIQKNDLSLIHTYHKLMRKHTLLELYTGYFFRHFLLRANATDYECLIRAISKVNLNLIFQNRKWIPLFLQGLLKTPSILKIMKNISRLPPTIKIDLAHNFY